VAFHNLLDCFGGGGFTMFSGRLVLQPAVFVDVKQEEGRGKGKGKESRSGRLEREKVGMEPLV
jgi:hypothetical protein